MAPRVRAQLRWYVHVQLFKGLVVVQLAIYCNPLGLRPKAKDLGLRWLEGGNELDGQEVTAHRKY
jgi:hypothetical protein